MKPTQVAYSELQTAYDMFNLRLFDGQLPECLITLQRAKNTCGYFSAERFSDVTGRKSDEIAMNPSYFAVVPLVEIMQTLVHEQCHVWQHHNGTPGRGRYHNTEWADKMEAIGLMPSSTGQPGGKRTGDNMADYPIDGGLFLDACNELFTQDFKISWYDRFVSPAVQHAGQNSVSLMLDLPEEFTTIAADEGVEVVEAPEPNKSNRSKYTCQVCDINIWGKPGLRVICGECNAPFTEL